MRKLKFESWKLSKIHSPNKTCLFSNPWLFFRDYADELQMSFRASKHLSITALRASCRTVGQIARKYKETQTWCDCHWYGLFCFCLFVEFYFVQKQTSDSNVSLKPKMFLFCFTKILNQAFYMTHTFDSVVSLHFSYSGPRWGSRCDMRNAKCTRVKSKDNKVVKGY